MCPCKPAKSDGVEESQTVTNPEEKSAKSAKQEVDKKHEGVEENQTVTNPEDKSTKSAKQEVDIPTIITGTSN